MKIKRSHLFHIINPSPWPIFTSIILFNILVGFILWVNRYILGGHIIVVGLVLLGFVIQEWFKDVIREASYEGKHTSLVQKGLKIGMLLFIVSEVMFFFGFFWAYFHFALSPSLEIGCIWPPYGIQVFNYLHVPLYNTFVLLLSGVFVTWCHHNIILALPTKIESNLIALIITLVLAINFTLWQLEEYRMAGFNISDSVFGSIFFYGNGVSWFSCYVRKFFFRRLFYSFIKE